MTELVFLGFDISSTGAGAALLREDGTVLSTWVWQDEGTESARLRSLAKWAARVEDEWWLHLPEGVDVVPILSMEAPFVQGANTRVLMRAQGAVMVQFEGDWSFYPPQSVKATARRSCGESGPMEKSDMIIAADERWPEWLTAPPVGITDGTKAQGDIADALWVAETDRLQVLQNRRGEE